MARLSSTLSSLRSRSGDVHARVEDGEPALAVGLGHVHRDVGVADEVRRPVDGVTRAGDADARGDDDRAVGDQVGRPELDDQPFGHRARAGEVGLVLGQDREFVAAEARDEVGRPDQAW